MRVKPILTEKSLADAKVGKYTFGVPSGATKYKIAQLVSDTFGVHVSRVWVVKKGPEIRKSYARKNPTARLPEKRAIVALAKGEKIDLFEEASE